MKVKLKEIKEAMKKENLELMSTPLSKMMKGYTMSIVYKSIPQQKLPLSEASSNKKMIEKDIKRTKPLRTKKTMSQRISKMSNKIGKLSFEEDAKNTSPQKRIIRMASKKIIKTKFI